MLFADGTVPKFENSSFFVTICNCNIDFYICCGHVDLMFCNFQNAMPFPCGYMVDYDDIQLFQNFAKFLPAYFSSI